MIEQNIFEIEEKTKEIVASILRREFRRSIPFVVCHELSIQTDQPEVLILIKIREARSVLSDSDEEINSMSTIMKQLGQLGIDCSRYDRLDCLSLGIKIPNKELDKIAVM